MQSNLDCNIQHFDANGQFGLSFEMFKFLNANGMTISCEVEVCVVGHTCPTSQVCTTAI